MLAATLRPALVERIGGRLATASDADRGVARTPSPGLPGPGLPGPGSAGSRTAAARRRRRWGPRRQNLGAAFWRLWFATGISASGDGLLLVALPLLTITLTRNLAAIAGVTAVTGVARAVASLPAGLLVDRLDRQRLMVMCNLVSALALVGLVLDMTIGRAHLFVVYAVAVILPLSDTTWDLAMWAHSPDLVRPDALATANGRLQGIDTGGEQLLGPAVGGSLFGLAQRLPFVGDCLSFVVSAWLCSSLPPPAVANLVEEGNGDAPGASTGTGASAAARGLAASPGAPRHAKPGWISNLMEGMDIFRQQKTLQLLAAAVGWLTFCFSMVAAMLVLYGTRLLHLKPTGYGLFLAAAALLGVAGSFFGGPLEKRLGPGPMVVAGCVAAAFSYLALAFTRSPVVAVFVFGLQETGMSVANVGLRTVRQRMIPRQLFGRVVGTYRLITSSTIPLGALLAAFIASRWGISTNMAVAGLLELASLPFVVPALLRHLAAAPSPKGRTL